jgi:hypothetical protein
MNDRSLLEKQVTILPLCHTMRSPVDIIKEKVQEKLNSKKQVLLHSTNSSFTCLRHNHDKLLKASSKKTYDY